MVTDSGFKAPPMVLVRRGYLFQEKDWYFEVGETPVYPFASDSRLVVMIKFSTVERSTTCFSKICGVEFTCNHARAVSSVG